MTDFGCACSTLVSTHGGAGDPIIPLGDKGDKVRQWNPKTYHAHPAVARTSQCTAIADQYSFIVMATQVLYGSSSKVYNSVRTHRVFPVDLARACVDVDAVFGAFPGMAVAVLGDVSLSLDRVLSVCRKVSGKLEPLKLPSLL